MELFFLVPALIGSWVRKIDSSTRESQEFLTKLEEQTEYLKFFYFISGHQRRAITIELAINELTAKAIHPLPRLDKKSIVKFKPDKEFLENWGTRWEEELDKL